jgi:TetR/AcrR family transcriptional regulator, repressor for neighboring sulfatase
VNATSQTRVKRVRRAPDEARDAILDAAERRLVTGGPSAVRVQLVARDVGLTDAAVHYHFRNRDGLLDDLLRRAGRRLRDELGAAVEGWDPRTLDVRELSRVIRTTFDGRRYARLTAWLALDGWRPKGRGMLHNLVDVVHEVRVEHARRLGHSEPAHEDTQSVIRLLLLVEWAEPLIGDSLRLMVGARRDPTATATFDAWFADILTRQLRNQGADH